MDIRGAIEGALPPPSEELATWTVVESWRACDEADDGTPLPGTRPLYLVVSSLAPDMPVAFLPVLGDDETANTIAREAMVEMAGVYAAVGVLGRCVFCRGLVSADHPSITIPHDLPSRRLILHADCAVEAVAKRMEDTDAASRN
jgi:hypothetical protein